MTRPSLVRRRREPRQDDSTVHPSKECPQQPNPYPNVAESKKHSRFGGIVGTMADLIERHTERITGVPSLSKKRINNY